MVQCHQQLRPQYLLHRSEDPGGMVSASDGAYELVVDGRPSVVAGPPLRSLAVALREDLGLTGPKLACEIGVCGACSVLVDGQLLSSCLLPVVLAAGHEVTTIAGLTPAEGLSPLQEAFVVNGATQCGYCTPGQIVAATALLAAEPHPTPVRIREWMAGNLCRCTGYVAIVAAVASAASEPAK